MKERIWIISNLRTNDITFEEVEKKYTTVYNSLTLDDLLKIINGEPQVFPEIPLAFWTDELIIQSINQVISLKNEYNRGLCFTYLPQEIVERISKNNLLLKLLESNQNIIKYLPSELLTEEHCLEIIKANPSRIHLLDKKALTEKICSYVLDSTNILISAQNIPRTVLDQNMAYKLVYNDTNNLSIINKEYPQYISEELFNSAVKGIQFRAGGLFENQNSLPADTFDKPKDLKGQLMVLLSNSDFKEHNSEEFLQYCIPLALNFLKQIILFDLKLEGVIQQKICLFIENASNSSQFSKKIDSLINNVVTESGKKFILDTVDKVLLTKEVEKIQLAISQKSKEASLSLLEESRDKNLLFHHLLQLAVQQQSKEIVKFLVELAPQLSIKLLPAWNYSFTPQEFKSYNKEYKAHLMNTRHIFFAESHPNSNNLITPSVAILKNTIYAGEKSELLDQLNFKNDIEFYTNYQKAPLMAPMLAIMALAALNKHEGPPNSNKSKKPLKIIVFDTPNMNYFNDNKIKVSGGLYTNRSTIYVGKPRSESIYHEACHMVAHEIMRNQCRPYPAENGQLEAMFNNILIEVRSNISKFPANTEQEKVARQAIFRIFDEYEESRWSVELIVKVPEIISIFGYEKGVAWLKEYTPTLLTYYEEHFQNACFDYLNRHQAEQYLDLDQCLKDELSAKKNIYLSKT